MKIFCIFTEKRVNLIDERLRILWTLVNFWWDNKKRDLHETKSQWKFFAFLLRKEWTWLMRDWEFYEHLWISDEVMKNATCVRLKANENFYFLLRKEGTRPRLRILWKLLNFWWDNEKRDLRETKSQWKFFLFTEKRENVTETENFMKIIEFLMR